MELFRIVLNNYANDYFWRLRHEVTQTLPHSIIASVSDHMLYCFVLNDVTNVQLETLYEDDYSKHHIADRIKAENVASYVWYRVAISFIL